MKKEMKSKKVVYILYFITILSLILGALVYKNIISPVSKIKASNQNILQTPRDIGGNLLSNPGFIFEDDNPNIPQVPGWYMFYGIGKPNQFQSGASPMIFGGPPGVPPLLGGTTPLITLKELARDESSPIWDFQGVDGGSGYVINKPENAKNIANIFLYPYSASSKQQMLSFVVDTRESADKAHKNLAMGIAQSVNVTPGKTYRFGISYYAPEDSTIEIRFYNGKRITGATDAVTAVDVNDSMLVWKDIYTQYKATSDTATVSLRFLVPEGKYSPPSFRNVWMEEMQGGGSGGGSGGGESGKAQSVKVEYYKNGVQDTSASYTIPAGILGRSFTVDNKAFSGYDFDYAMVGSSQVNSLPVVGYFSTSQQTVKMYYKSKTPTPKYGNIKLQPRIKDTSTNIGTASDIKYIYGSSYTVNSWSFKKSQAPVIKGYTYVGGDLNGMFPPQGSTKTEYLYYVSDTPPAPEYQLKVTPEHQVYTDQDSQPTDKDRLSWVKEPVLVNKDGDYKPIPYGLDIQSVTITARQSSVGSTTWTPTSTVDMRQVGKTLNYRVTVVGKDNLDGLTYTATNVEVPITIKEAVSAELVVKETKDQLAWTTTDPPLTPNKDWVKVVVKNGTNETPISNPTVEITGKKNQSGQVESVNFVDMLEEGTTEYQLKVSTTYDSKPLEATATIKVTIKKLELSAEPISVDSIGVNLGATLNSDLMKTWVTNVRLQGTLAEGMTPVDILIKDNPDYDYQVALKAGEVVDTTQPAIQTVTLLVTGTTNINGAQTFGPVEVEVTLLIGGLELTVPEELPFKDGDASAYVKQVLGCSDPDWAIQVSDKRQNAQNNWKVSVRLTEDFEATFETTNGTQTRTIKDILIYKDQGANTEGHLIDDELYPIFDGKGDDSKTWDDGSGFLLSISAIKSLGIQEGEYNATLNFNLSDVP